METVYPLSTLAGVYGADGAGVGRGSADGGRTIRFYNHAGDYMYASNTCNYAC